MGGRGASFRAAESPIKTGTRDLEYSAIGKTFDKLPANLKTNINDNLKMSANMQRDIANGRRNNITDEWVTGFGKNKIKVITDVLGGKAVYTIKQKNKILKKNVTKEQAANAVAAFYLDALEG